MHPTIAIDELAAWLREAGTVTALTGAGISTDSGIPDFRGPQGLWTKDPKAEKLSNLQHYMADPELRQKAWELRLDHPAWDAVPGPGHLALAEMERKGVLHHLITQNIDGLHQAAGTSSEILVEVHGTLREVMCMSCGERANMQRALDRVRAGEADPDCRTCGGILKSATISFGQELVAEDIARAQRAAETSDVFLAIGTSLTVYPVAYLPQIAIASGAKLVIVNEQQTPFDPHAAALFHAPIADILPALAETL